MFCFVENCHCLITYPMYMHLSIMSEGKMGTSYITINAITGGVIFEEMGTGTLCLTEEKISDK